MSNSIRTPSKGKHATSRRIAEAVDNEDWQKFRISMKGKSTFDKLSMLEGYYDRQVEEIDEECFGKPNFNEEFNKRLDIIKIRIDNYIKALCRGGQLEPGMTFDHFNDGSIRNHIRK